MGWARHFFPAYPLCSAPLPHPSIVTSLPIQPSDQRYRHIHSTLGCHESLAMPEPALRCTGDARLNRHHPPASAIVADNHGDLIPASQDSLPDISMPSAASGSRAPLDRENSTIFLRGLPYDMLEPQLIDMLQQYGRVESCRVNVDNCSGRGRGSGVATFVTTTEAIRAKNHLHDRELRGRKLTVRWDKEGGDHMPINPSGASNSGSSSGEREKRRRKEKKIIKGKAKAQERLELAQEETETHDRHEDTSKDKGKGKGSTEVTGNRKDRYPSSGGLVIVDGTNDPGDRNRIRRRPGADPDNPEATTVVVQSRNSNNSISRNHESG